MTDDTPTLADNPDTTDHGADDTPAGRRRNRGPDAEAATRRRQLRDVEAERDQLTERLNRGLRRDVERIAAARLAQPGDVWDVGKLNLDDVLDDAGDVDTTAVETAVAALLEARPGLGHAPPKFPDMAGGKRGDLPDPPVSWRDVIRGQ